MRLLAAILTQSSVALFSSFGAAPEPYLPLNGGAFSGAPQPSSPDPLIRYVWTPGAYNASALQIFSLPPVAAGPTPATNRSSFLNASSCVGASACALTVAGAGTLLVDFGVETAGWFEFDSNDITAGDAGLLQLGISEYATYGRGGWVGGYKVGGATRYGSTFRLETNDELYEGVRYASVTLTAAPSAPFTITALRVVAQALPVNYEGAFHSAGDPLLERVWWTGAYTIRVLLLPTYMGSVLMDRGDRISWTGDAFVSQSTFYSFSSAYGIPKQNLLLTSCDDCCQGIASYCLLFVLSACNYLEQTNDTATFLPLVPTIERKLEEAQRRVTTSDFPLHSMRFWGWDDRTGSGFANDTTPETIAQYKFLSIRCWTTFSAAVAPFNASLSARYAGYAAAAVAALRAAPAQPWWGQLGLHAGADALNAGFVTPEEAAGIVALALSDIVTLPSLSHFNSFFVLTAASAAGQLDGGVEQVRRFWGADLALGATTFFEVGHPELASILQPGPTALPGEQNGWTLLCADWSTGATQWLSQWVLGVRPLAPGFSRALFAPHIAHGMEGVAGAHPTPHGIIAVRVDGGAVEVAAPAGVGEVVVQLSEVTLARMGLSGAPLEALVVEVEAAGVGAGAGALPASVGSPGDAPLLDERAPGGPRARALFFSLPGGTRWRLRVRNGGAARGAPIRDAPTLPPYGPPSYPGQFLGTDATTRGDWRGVFGAEGYALFGFDVSGNGFNPFCGGGGEGGQLVLTCSDPGATLTVTFASYGTAPWGLCPNLAASSCSAPSSLAVMGKACNGKSSCAVDVNTNTFGGDPCYGTPKMLSAVATCTSGGGHASGGVGTPADRVQLPPWVKSVTVVNSSAGFLGVSANWVNASADARALADPTDASRRALGVTQPCGGPTSPVDIAVGAGAPPRFTLRLYFVDWGAAPACGALDGSPRTQELLIMKGYPNLAPLAPRLLLQDFAGGVWLSYELPTAEGVRVRISTVTGDMAVLSAVAFDAA